MAALNHIIVPAKDKHASARFLADILGVEPEAPWGHFVPVRTSNGVALDFIDSKDVRTQHYAFLVDDTEFDAGFGKIKDRGIAYYARRQERPRRDQPLLGRLRRLLRGPRRPPARADHQALRRSGRPSLGKL